MNTDLLKTIQTSWDNSGQTKQDLFNIFFGSGVTDKHKTDILTFLDNGKIVFDLGGSPESLWWDYCKVKQDRESQQKEKARLLSVDQDIESIKSILNDYKQNKNVLTTTALVDPIADLGKLTEKLSSTVKPSKVDSQQLLTPTTKESFIERIKSKPPALKTSYMIDGDNLRFQTGALSIVAAPTGHGKTTFLINLLLDAVNLNPNKRHWLFSYEEDETAILIKALNTFCNYRYTANNKRTIESGYRGDNSYFGDSFSDFKVKEKQFWKLVDQGAINIVQADYSTEELMKAIKTVSGDNAGFVGIDYLQMLYTDNKDRYTTRQEELKRVCLDLKDLAIDTGLAIVSAGQFNRQVTSPGAMESQRIADASDIEKASNQVIGLWNGDKKPLIEDKLIINDNEMYLKVLKSRDGKSDIDAKYSWDGNKGVIGFEPIGNQSAQDKTPEMFKDDKKQRANLLRG